MSLTRDAVLDVLRTLSHPRTGADLVGADIIRALDVSGGKVRFVIEVAPEEARAMEPLRQQAVDALEAIAGKGNVAAALTAHAPTHAPVKGAAAQAAPNLSPARKPAAPQGPQPIPGVKAVVAVASGKGGVGKSTVAANLAVALAQEGRAVGLLDADVYGPSQPRMMGVSGRPASPDGKIIIPLRGHGVTLMSIGFMTKEDEALIWRGPMLMGALQQMIGQVQWGALDVLVIDLPPGTGDVQLTLAQKTALAGAVVVSTPQDIALLDVRKALDMFSKTGTRVLGMVENMSTHVCSNCGHEEHIFGHGGARENAERLGLPFLGEIPLDIAIRRAGDAGAPVVAARPDSPQAEAFRAIARALIAQGGV